MATYLDNLKTRRDAIAAELAAGQTGDGQKFTQPSINIDGETMDTDKYVQRLYDELERLEKLIARQEGAWQVKSIAQTP